jgi:hypothetical protein
MPNLTDEEVGQLLRETFVEKENLLDQLPEANTGRNRRWRAPLLAAACVLAVLAGTMWSVGTNHRQEAGAPRQKQEVSASQPVRTTQVGESTSMELWPLGPGLAIKEAVKWERPDAGWPIVRIVEAPDVSVASPTPAMVVGGVFSDSDRSEIEALAGESIEWVKGLPKGSPGVCPQGDGSPYVTVSPLVLDQKDSSFTIAVSVWRSCTAGRWVTYRLAKVRNAQGGSDWKITGTVGPQAVS